MRALFLGFLFSTTLFAAPLATTEEDFKNYLTYFKGPNFYQINPRALEARLQLLDKASPGSQFRILTFVFDLGETTKRLAAHMCQAAQRGVKVKFMADSKSGSIPGAPNLFDHPETEEIYQYLANCGVQVRIYNHMDDFLVAASGKAYPKKILRNALHPELSPLNRLNHRKLFHVENLTNACMFLGGRNLGDHYLDWDSEKDNFWDSDVLLCKHFLKPNDQKALDQAKASFDELWNHEEIALTIHPKKSFQFKTLALPKPTFVGSTEHPTGGNTFPHTFNWKVVTASWNPAEDKVRQELYAAIEREQAEIFIETAYAQFDSKMASLIEAALERGVHVILVTNSLFTSDGPSKAIRLLEARFVRNLLNKYGAARNSNRMSVLEQSRFSGPRSKGTFWYYVTTIHSGHMIHFKGAAFKCQKFETSKGTQYLKTFILGSHNFHTRSGLSDKEHDLVWNEHVGKTCLYQVGEDAFSPEELERINQRYFKNPDGTYGEIHKSFMDVADSRIEFYRGINYFYKDKNRPVLVPYDSLYEELSDAVDGEKSKENLGKLRYWKARILRRVLFSEEESEQPQLRGGVETMLNLLGPLWQYSERFF